MCSADLTEFQSYTGLRWPAQGLVLQAFSASTSRWRHCTPTLTMSEGQCAFEIMPDAPYIPSMETHSQRLLKEPETGIEQLNERKSGLIKPSEPILSSFIVSWPCSANEHIPGMSFLRPERPLW